MAHEDGHYQPLPQIPNWDENRLRQFFHRQTISAQRLITGSLQADQTVSSSNFSSGSAGWQIDGNGDAEFNNVTVRGDLVGNWDGADPADLLNPDTTATTGFYFDASRGRAQLMGKFRAVRLAILNPDNNNAEEGSLHINNFDALELTSGGDLDVVSGADLFLFAESASTVRIGVGSTSGTPVATFGPNGAEIRAEDGAAGSPSYTFDGDTNTGMYRVSSDRLGFSAGASTKMSIDTDVQIVTPTTTGSAADLNVGSSALTDIRRSTSALKYKEEIEEADWLADIDLIPTKHWRKDDKRWRYGFVADWLADQDSLLGVYEGGEVESYDSRAVMNVLAAKINRLEKALGQRNKLPSS